MVTLADVRAVALSLPRTEEHLIRGTVPAGHGGTGDGRAARPSGTECLSPNPGIPAARKKQKAR
jgi:hypothetical protein